MPIRGWYARYSELIKEFGYTKSKDTKAAQILDKIIKKPIPESKLIRLISDKPVLVIGAGSSLGSALPKLRKLQSTKIVADSAVEFVLKAGILPDIVVTDLDGDQTWLQKAADLGSLMLVHAHGDNIDALPVAKKFPNAMATTQANPVGKVRNYGGFTDGDRCVFLAESFRAEKIILFGMNFDGRIGTYSTTAPKDRKLKIAKLYRARSLLEWLAKRSHSHLYTTSSQIAGFERITYNQVDSLT